MHKVIGSILKYGTILSTLGIIIMVLIQIYARFFLPNSPSWTEEASRLFFIYALSFAAGLAVKNHYYVHLDYFFNKFSEKTQKVIMLIIPLTTALLFLIVAIYSLDFIVQGHAERSPSLKVRMSYVFFSIFIMGASICYYSVLEFIRQIKNYSK